MLEESRHFIGDSSECNAVALVTLAAALLGGESTGEVEETVLLVAAGFLNGTLMLWDAESGELVARWRAHEVGIISLMSFKRGELWSHGRDGWCYRWELSSGVESNDMVGAGRSSVGIMPPASPTHILCLGYASFCPIAGLLLPPPLPVPSSDSLSFRGWTEILVGAALKTEDVEVWAANESGGVDMICAVSPLGRAGKRGMVTATQLFRSRIGPAISAVSPPAPKPVSLGSAMGVSSSFSASTVSHQELGGPVDTCATNANDDSPRVLLAASYESGHLDIRCLPGLVDPGTSLHKPAVAARPKTAAFGGGAVDATEGKDGGDAAAELVLSLDILTAAPILSFSLCSEKYDDTQLSNTPLQLWGLVAAADASVAIVTLDLGKRAGSVLRKLILPCKGALYRTLVFPFSPADSLRGCSSGKLCGAYGGRDGFLRLIDLETGEELSSEVSSDSSGGSSITSLASSFCFQGGVGNCDRLGEDDGGGVWIACGFKSGPVGLWRLLS